MHGERPHSSTSLTGQHNKNARWQGAPRAMGEVGETFRLASGVFYEPRKLGSAIAELHADGFTRRDMCLAGTREALGSVMQQTATPPLSLIGKALNYRQLRPLYPLLDDVEVVATSGALLRKLLKEAAWSGTEQEQSSSWLLPDLFGRFTDHMRQSAIVLLVSAPDSNLQHRSSRTLLRHSAHTVQTHEFTPARPAGS
jgi:hypothetical protein